MGEHSPRTWPYVAVGVLGAVVGTVLLLWRGASAWMAPFAGLIIAISAVVLPMAAVNGLMALFIADEDWQPEVKRAGVVTGLCSLIPLLAGVAWFSPTFRTTVLSKLSEETRRTAAVGALQDPSVAVAAEGCRHLVQLSPDLERQTLLDALDRRHEVATTCLNRPYQTSGAKERAESYAGVLTKRWQAQAFDSSNAKRACRQMTYGLELPTKKSVGSPALLTCALDGSSAELRACCADQVQKTLGTGSELVDALGTSLESEVAGRLLGPFLSASLHQRQLSDKQVAIADQLGMTDPSVRRFAVQFACSSLMSDRHAETVTRQLAAWVSEDACVGSAEFMRTDAQRVKAVCKEALPLIEQSDRPGEALCHVADRDRKRKAVGTASAIVKAAFASGERRKFAAEIHRGYHQTRSKAGLENHLGRMFSAGQGGSMRPQKALSMMGTLANRSRDGLVEQMQSQLEADAKSRRDQLREMFKGVDISETMKKLDEKSDKADIPDEIKEMSDEEEQIFKGRPGEQ